MLTGRTAMLWEQRGSRNRLGGWVLAATIGVFAAGASPAEAIYSFARTWGHPGGTAADLNGPDSIAVSPTTGDVYVGDGNPKPGGNGLERVVEFSATGSFVRQWSAQGNDPGIPNGIALGPHDDVYVAFAGGHVQRFDQFGLFQSAWDVPSILRGIATDGCCSVYVASTDGLSMSSGHVYVYTLGGALFAKLGGGGTQVGEFGSPEGVAATPAPRRAGGGKSLVYITDFHSLSVRIFDGWPLTIAGNFAGGWQVTSPNGRRHHPGAIALGPAGDVFVGVGDYIQKYSPFGRYIVRFGGYGSGPGQIQGPLGIAVARNGNVYVADGFNARVDEWQAIYPNTAGRAKLGTGSAKSASFTFTGFEKTAGSPVSDAGPFEFQCKLDSGKFKRCQSPENYTQLSKGEHTFAVRAIDNAALADGSPFTYTWKVK